MTSAVPGPPVELQPLAAYLEAPCGLVTNMAPGSAPHQLL